MRINRIRKNLLIRILQGLEALGSQAERETVVWYLNLFLYERFKTGPCGIDFAFEEAVQLA